MAASALLILTTLTVGQLTVLAQKDCPVLVTGPNQQWTPARRLELIPVATSTDRQFAGQPPGRSELSFSVQSLLSGLEIQLFSTRHPGGYLLHVDADGWRAERTFVGAVHTSLSSGSPPSDRTTAADEWSSYAVSVSRPDTVRLQRLYDNGTRQLWLELRHPEALSVDSASARVTPPPSEQRMLNRSRGIGPEASGDWGFWKFDCSKFYYQTAELCHLWPSWPSDVPLRFRTLRRRNPVTSVNVPLSAAGTSELHLFETPERFYLVTLSPSELTLGRAERGVPAARQVARACLASQSSPSSPSSRSSPPPFRILWVSILRGFISVGVEGAQPCLEDDAEATPSPTVGPATETVMTTVDPISGSEEVTEETSQVTGVTAGQLAATTTPKPGRTPLVTWQDGIHYSVLSYGVRTTDGQGVWTVGCQPSPDPDEDKTTSTPLTTSDPATDPDVTDAGADRSCRAQQTFLLATVVLAVVSVVLLLVAVLLVTALVSQRRRWSAELAGQRRLSLVNTDLFGAPPAAGENEYAEVYLYDSVRPMSVRPGESTFKPLRREPTPETTVDEVPVFEEGEAPVIEGEAPVFEGEVPVFEGLPETREASVEPLPRPPDNI